MMKILSKVYLISVFVLLLSVLVFSSSAFAQLEMYGMASGGPGGVYYHHASGFAQYIEEKLPDIRITVDVSAGSVENVRRVDRKEAHFGLAFIYNAYEAFKGMEEWGWEKEYSNIRGIAMYLWPETNWVTLKQKNIESIEDLKGKKMSLGPPGSGSAVIAERMLKALNVFNDIIPSYLPFADAAAALKDGQIDVFVGPGGYPAASLTEVATTHDMVLISLTNEELDKCLKELPGSVKGVVPAGAYRGLEQPVQQSVSPSLVIVHKDVPEESVYKIVSNFFTEEGLDYAGDIHQDWKRVIPVDQRVLEGMVIPLHPGAAKYWEELGLEIPEQAKPID
jgi:hypothetical protein